MSLRPSKDEVFLVVPQGAMSDDSFGVRDFSSGGSVALLNYDLMTMRSESGGTSRDYLSATAELGFNVGDWIMRSRQMYTKIEDSANYQHLYAYAQRTFAEHKTVVQRGQININNPLFSGAAINGLQILPETELIGSYGSGSLVEGGAQAQSTVEVRQVGALIYTTVVPEGPFALSDIPLLNSGSDLDVTVRDINGAERHFVVSTASFRTAVAARPGYTFSAGKVRNLGNSDKEQPWVTTGTGTWMLSKNLTATSGLMLTADYQAVGWGADTSLAKDTSLSIRNVYSNATKEGEKRIQASVSVSSRLTENVTASISATQQNMGYLDLTDTLLSSDNDWYKTRFQSQYSASLGWSNNTPGSFNVMVGEVPAFQTSLHADQCFVAERRGRLVRAAGKASTISGCLHQRGRTENGYSSIYRGSQ